MKILCIFLLLSTLAFSAETQKELWQQVQKAEEENRIEDAILLLQKASQLDGPYSEEIEISLQAYAEVLHRPELIPVTTSKEPAKPSAEWTGYVDLGGYAGQYAQKNDVETYKETYAGAMSAINVDWTLVRGETFHTVSVGLGVDENVPLSATGIRSDDSSLAANYTLEPSIGYSLLWDRLLFGSSIDVSVPQKDDPTLSGTIYTSVALLRSEAYRWNLAASAYGGPLTRDLFSLRTSISRKMGYGISGTLSVAYLVSLDSSSRLDSAVLYSSNSGPEAGLKLGWKGAKWRLETSASYSMSTNFSKDEWIDNNRGTVLNWKKQSTKLKLGLLGFVSLTKVLEGNASINYQVRDYPNMVSNHPEYYLAKTTTLGASFGITYSF